MLSNQNQMMISLAVDYLTRRNYFSSITLLGNMLEHDSGRTLAPTSSTLVWREVAEPFGEYWKDIDFRNQLNPIDTALGYAKRILNNNFEENPHGLSVSLSLKLLINHRAGYDWYDEFDHWYFEDFKLVPRFNNEPLEAHWDNWPVGTKLDLTDQSDNVLETEWAHELTGYKLLSLVRQHQYK